MVTVILFYAVIFVGFGLWIFWRFMSNDLYNEYILYGVMGGVCLTDFILLMFVYRKLTVITIIALVITFLFSLMVNTAFLARSESIRETIEDRRMAIDLWKDVVIDVAYAFRHNRDNRVHAPCQLHGRATRARSHSTKGLSCSFGIGNHQFFNSHYPLYPLKTLNSMNHRL